MGERSDPIEALERIGWYLNYRAGERVSINSVAKATGLAWATVQKYTNALETIQQLAPRVSYTSDGIDVGRKPSAARELFSDPEVALAVYLFVNSQQNGSPLEPLDFSDHSDVLCVAPDAVDTMESLGWIERDDSHIGLTELGVQIAGPLYSEVRTGNGRDEVLKIDREGRELRAVIDFASSGPTAQTTRANILDVEGKYSFTGEGFSTSYGNDWNGREQYA